MEWQINWKCWWHLWPYYSKTDFGDNWISSKPFYIKVFCIGPLQMRWYSS